MAHSEDKAEHRRNVLAEAPRKAPKKNWGHLVANMQIEMAALQAEVERLKGLIAPVGKRIVGEFRENVSIVETIKGAKFWGKLIAFHALGTANPGAVVEAIDPGFDGCRHVYPLAQLRIRKE